MYNLEFVCVAYYYDSWVKFDLLVLIKLPLLLYVYDKGMWNISAGAVMGSSWQVVWADSIHLLSNTVAMDFI